MSINSWLASCAACSQSGTGIDRWDPSATSHPLWAQRFSEFSTTGAFVSATGTSSKVTKTLTRFISGEPWKVLAQNLTYYGDYARVEIEFLASGAVVLAVALKPAADFTNIVHVGNTLATLAAKSTFGANPNVDGILVASNSGLKYIPRAGVAANTSAFSHAKDLSGVTQVRIAVEAKTGYKATLNLCAYASIELMGRLGGTVTDADGNPASRAVRAIREDTSAFVSSTDSDGTTGAYDLYTDYSGAHTLLAYPSGGESLPALALRGVTPI